MNACAPTYKIYQLQEVTPSMAVTTGVSVSALFKS